MTFNLRKELKNSCTGNIADFFSFILSFGLEEISTSSWPLQAALGCTWVGLGWGRGCGSVFLDPWDHKLHPTRVPLCLAPRWWFHAKSSYRPGKAAVKWFSSEIIGPKPQLSASLCTPRSWPHPPVVEVLRGEQTTLVNSGNAGLAGPRGLRQLSSADCPRETGPFLWNRILKQRAKDFHCTSSKPWMPRNLEIFLRSNVHTTEMSPEVSNAVLGTQ